VLTILINNEIAKFFKKFTKKHKKIEEKPEIILKNGEKNDLLYFILHIQIMVNKIMDYSNEFAVF